MQEYQKNLQQIGHIVRELDPNTDPALLALIAQHLCVRLSGAIETAVRYNIERILKPSSHPRATGYISKRLGDFRNPKPDKIIQLLQQFDKAWAASLETFWEVETKDAIVSIVNQRNIIAHGGTTNVTLSSVKRWYASTKRFCAFLETLS